MVVINASPDGYNINKNAGSTHPEQLQAMVKASQADLGVAFDGDADRCLAVDGTVRAVGHDAQALERLGLRAVDDRGDRGHEMVDVHVGRGGAYLTSVLNVEMGAVISASHNPMPDNGIKFFARGGFKLPDSKEDEIEDVLGQDWDRPTGAGVGRVSHDSNTATNMYIDHLVATIGAHACGERVGEEIARNAGVASDQRAAPACRLLRARAVAADIWSLPPYSSRTRYSNTAT